MVSTLAQALGCVTLFSFCWMARAQTYSTEPVVSIVPRSTPEVAANPNEAPQGHLRVDTSLVLVPVHATSPIGANITDLMEANFRVFEDGVEQKITLFSKEDAPLSVGLVFDSSASMNNKIRKSAEAAAAFLKTSNTGDEFFLIEFGERPKLLTPFTADSSQIYRQIMRSRPFGRTSLIDAIHLALLQMKYARNARKAIVILSDGGDNRSRFTRAEISGALLESDVQVYAMGIFDPEGLTKHSREEANGPQLLAELAEHTGGRVYPVDSLNDLDAISAMLGNALRTEYLLGYVPSNDSRDGKYRHLTVKLAIPPGKPVPSVFYRRGYYAPTQ